MYNVWMLDLGWKPTYIVKSFFTSAASIFTVLPAYYTCGVTDDWQGIHVDSMDLDLPIELLFRICMILWWYLDIAVFFASFLWFSVGYQDSCNWSTCLLCGPLVVSTPSVLTTFPGLTTIQPYFSSMYGIPMSSM